MPKSSPPAAAPRDERHHAIFWLAFACLAWGWSFPAMKWGSEAIAETAPPTGVLAVAAAFIGGRFLLATLLYGAWACRGLRGFTREDWLGGVTVGGTFAAGLFLQIIGLRYTLPSVSSFLTALYVVLLPLAQALILRRPPRVTLWLAVALALGGLMVLGAAGAEAPAAPPPFAFAGETFTLLSALLFTAQILFLDRYGARACPARLTFIMFAVTAAAGLAVLLALPDGRALCRPAVLQDLARNWRLQWTLATTVVFSSALSFHLMNKHQPRIAPAVAGVVYCLEPVCATGSSVLLGVEGLPLRLFLGGGLILGAVFLAAGGLALLADTRRALRPRA